MRGAVADRARCAWEARLPGTSIRRAQRVEPYGVEIAKNFSTSPISVVMR
jgi:hypothetical protein